MTYSNNTGLPSVTQVINPWLPTQFFTEESRQRGTYVHEWAKHYLLGAWFPLTHPEWQGYVESLKSWIDTHLTEVALVEKRLIHPALKYCGQMDLFGRVSFKKGLGQLDWKTSESADDWWGLQSWAYCELGTVNGHPIEWGGSVRAHADGSPATFKAYDPKNWPAMRNTFISHLNCWNYHNA
jgi:hypothetical protein